MKRPTTLRQSQDSLMSIPQKGEGKRLSTKTANATVILCGLPDVEYKTASRIFAPGSRAMPTVFEAAVPAIAEL
jgi:hypothetical protein